MKKEEFFEKAAVSVKEKMGGDFEVTIKAVKKNNNVTLNGLVIARTGINIAPTIYLDSFWKSFRWGMSMDSIVEKIMEIYEKETPRESIEIEFFKDFAKVRDKICYRLINYCENEKLLSDIPHERFLDLAVCFYYAYESAVLGKGSILVHNSHMKMWNTDTDELMEIASANTSRLNPAEICSMDEVLDIYEEAYPLKGEKEGAVSCFPMYVLSNKAKLFGAAAILYQGIFEEVAEKIKGNFFVIPSSIHEVILMPEDENADGEEIKRMIREVNATQVEPEERLSDSLYRYNCLEKKLKIFE